MSEQERAKKIEILKKAREVRKNNLKQLRIRIKIKYI